jgi:hypothetical protein
MAPGQAAAGAAGAASAAALVAPIAPGQPPPPPTAATGPITAPQPAAPGPGGGPSLQPQAPKRPVRTIVKEKPTRRLQPGDLICAECGEGNAPVRKFCSRCGTSLAEAETVKQKWWQKLWPKRKQKLLDAGQRPGRGDVKKKRKLDWQPILRYGRMILGGIILFSSVLYAVYSPWRNFVNEKFTAAKDWATDLVTQQQVNVRPIDQTSDAVTPPEPAGNELRLAFDNINTTTWIFTPNAPGTFSTITVQFGRPVNIENIIVHNGHVDAFTEFLRPKDVHLVFTNRDSFDLTLEDAFGPTTYEIENAQGITEMEIQIENFHGATGLTQAALTEIEFVDLD